MWKDSAGCIFSHWKLSFLPPWWGNAAWTRQVGVCACHFLSSSRDMTTCAYACECVSLGGGGEEGRVTMDSCYPFSAFILPPPPPPPPFLHSSNPTWLQNKADVLANGCSHSTSSAKWIHYGKLALGRILHLTSALQNLCSMVTFFVAVLSAKHTEFAVMADLKV